MQLSEFITNHLDDIVAEWERFARTLDTPAEDLGRAALRDHARSLLLAAARDMCTSQTEAERQAKSRGEIPSKTPSLEVAAASHGENRHHVGFNLVQMTAEFRHLRACVLRMWSDSLKPEQPDFEQTVRFNESIDQAMAESIAVYAAQVERSRDIFLAILGHDLRAPLQAVTVSTELLIRKVDLDETALTYAARIKTGARHMAAMVNDLLGFVRCRLGNGLPIERSEMNLAHACQAALDEACAGQPQQQPILMIQGDTLGDWDRGRIDQLLQNLIGNALQHGLPETPITLILTGEPETVTLAVHNQGPPISPEARVSIFDPLVRNVSEEQDKPDTSLGLGLFIVHEVVTAHGGTIDVDSSAEAGTTFRVILPRRVVR